MKKTIVIAIILTMLLFQAAFAFAGQNLVAIRVEELTGEYKDGKVTLAWETEVEDTTGRLTISTNKIKIYRGYSYGREDTEIGVKDVNQEVDNGDLPTGLGYRNKKVKFQFVDTDVEKDKTYYYKVACGSVSGKWASVRVTSTESAGLVDEKRKRYEEGSDWPERLAGSILLAVPNYLMKVLDLYDPLELIFQTKVVKSDSLKDLKTPEIAKGGNAVQQEIDRVGGNIINLARGVVGVVGVILVIWIGIIITGAYNDPNRIMLAKKMFAGLVVCVLLVFAAEKIAGTLIGLIGYTPVSTTTSSSMPGQVNDALFYTFTSKEFEALASYYDRLNEFIPVSLVVVIVLLGMGILYTSTNPNAKISFREYSLGLFLGLFTLKFGIYALSVIFDINYALVKFFEWVAGDSLDNSFLDTLISTDTMSLGQAIVTFLAVFSIGLLNWQYTIRKIIIALLIGLIPVVAVIAIIPSRRNALDYWFKEFISQVFMQAAHAAVLSFGILLIYANADFWIKLACIMGLPSIAVVVRRIMGAESFGSSAIGGVGTMLGLGSLFALGKILAPKKSPFSSETLGTAGETSGAVAGGMVGGMAGKIANFGLKAGTALTAGMAGGFLTGAATGNPAFGIASGITAGTMIGGGISEAISKSASLFGMTPDERAKALGVAHPGMLDEPGEAYAAGKRLFGEGLMGKTAAAGYAGFKSARAFFGMSDPGLAMAAKKSIGDTRRDFMVAKSQLADFKPSYEEAKANFTHAKNLFSPQSLHMKDLQNKAETLEIGKNRAEDSYIKAVNFFDNEIDTDDRHNSSWKQSAALALERVSRTQMVYQDSLAEYETSQNAINNGQKIYEESRKQLEITEAEQAKKQASVSGLERSLTVEGIRKEFEKLQQQRAEIGGINTSWR